MAKLIHIYKYKTNIYIYICIECIVYTNEYLNILCTVRIKSFNQTNMLLRFMFEPLI